MGVSAHQGKKEREMEKLFDATDWVTVPPIKDDTGAYQEKVVYNSDLIRPKRKGREMYPTYALSLIAAGIVAAGIVSISEGPTGNPLAAALLVIFSTGLIIIVTSIMLAHWNFDLS